MMGRISFATGLFALCILWVVVSLIAEPSKVVVETPDFKSIQSIPERKQVFFEFFGALVDEENAEILELRKRLQHNPSPKFVRELAQEYRLEIGDSVSEQDVSELLKRVDIVPRSLALAQAANESAWGMSRFATEGNNYFGQWCYSKGCGLVPSQRNAGATHEVRYFESAADSVAAYIANINQHRSYRELRDIRAKARKNNEEIHGCILAKGLKNYSERGQHYIEEIKQMIRINDLTPYSERPCAAIALPEEQVAS